MPISLPPWLNIAPEQFTQAAIAGGAQGFQAAAQAGELAQRGLLEGAKLAQDAAARAAEIAVRREQINANLAENAARVSAARAEAAAQNAVRQQDLVFRQQAQEAAQQQAAAELAAGQEQAGLERASREKIAGMRIDRGFAPSEASRMLDEASALEAAGKKEQADMLRDVLKKRGTFAPAGLTPDQTAQAKALGERLAEIEIKLSQPGKTFFTREDKPPDPDLIKQRDTLQRQLDVILGRSKATNAPASITNPPASQGPLRYVLTNGQYRLTQ